MILPINSFILGWKVEKLRDSILVCLFEDGTKSKSPSEITPNLQNIHIIPLFIIHVQLPTMQCVDRQ